MKYLSLYISVLSFGFCENPTGAEKRLCDIKNKEVAMVECGFNESNVGKFYRRVFSERNLIVLACLESKDAEFESKKAQDAADIANAKNSARELMKVDCANISGADKHVCYILKGLIKNQ